MDLLFYDKNLNIVGLIDTAKSVQWLERYYEVGKFEVYVQVTADVLNIVNQSYFIARNDSDYVGVIDYIENEDDIDNGNYLIIQGSMAESLIGRRIIRNITYLTNNLSYICNTLLQENIINPVLQQGETISPRKMNCLHSIVTNNLTINPTMEIQTSFENNLLTYLINLLKSYQASIRLKLNQNNKFEIILYNGTDRSYAQNTNAYVVFSKEFDNLISTTYEYNATDETNALYVGGEDNEYAVEGRIIDKYELPVGSGVVSDIDRKETFVNASDLKQTWKDEEEVEHTLTTQEYRDLLKTRGQESVIEPTEKLAAIVNDTTYILNQDYFMGDIVTIYNETLGLYTNKRIIGMDRVDDENGTALEPIFEE